MESAYLDPGSGSVIIQALVGGIAAAGVMFKFYGRRLLVFLRLRRPDAPVSEGGDG